MKNITIPEPVDVTGAAGNTGKLSLHKLFVDLLIPKLPKSDVSGLTIIAALDAKLDAKPGAVAELTDAEHEVLAGALPQDLPGALMLRTIPLYTAVLGAK